MEPQFFNDYNHNPYISKTYERIYKPNSGIKADGSE